MATAPVSFAPALTPHTLGALADTFERVQLPDKAQSLRRLQPFVKSAVEEYFAPLLVADEQSSFAHRFNSLCRDFEFTRLYLNIRLIAALGSQDFLGRYEETLRDVLGPLMDTARQMNMNPELISAIIRDFAKILHALGQVTNPAKLQINDLSFQDYKSVKAWFHAATRFDYGLTAVLLVLEKSIPEPVPADRDALLAAFQKALLEYARATSRVFPQGPMQHALKNLETSHIKLTTTQQHIGIESPSSATQTRRDAGLDSSARHTEMNWLARNKDLSDRFGGQWIVLEKDDLIASDADYQKARQTAVHKGIKRPFIIFVPLKENGGFMGI